MNNLIFGIILVTLFSFRSPLTYVLAILVAFDHFYKKPLWFTIILAVSFAYIALKATIAFIGTSAIVLGVYFACVTMYFLKKCINNIKN